MEMQNETQSRIELEKEVSGVLSEIERSSLNSPDTAVDLINLIDSISELAGIILERCEFIEKPNESVSNVSVNHIQNTVSRIQTICRIANKMIEVEDYMAVSMLFFLKGQLDRYDTPQMPS